ncbi:MAG: hypothetical protein QM528_04115 [Phycisphaerales bacterium]|nr:hypothetical protein [Phycisphaerales bacterium]
MVSTLLSSKNFTNVQDVKDINGLVQLALQMKAKKKKSKIGADKRIGLIFLNPSMRTRISSQIAAKNLGLDIIVLNLEKDSWLLEFNETAIMNGSTVEHIKDAAPILGEYFDLLGIRTFPTLKNKDEDYKELVLQQLIKYSKLPIISLESATLHPLQSLADIITIQEHFSLKRKPKVVLTWAPHIKPLPQCVANSFAQWMNRWNGADFVITHPKGYELSEVYTQNAQIVYDQKTALDNADFIYVKNWSSYNNYGQMPPVEADWMLQLNKLPNNPKVKIMHCLPVRRNIELSSEVLDSNHCITTEQAKNRVWAAQSVMHEILKQIQK